MTKLNDTGERMIPEFHKGKNIYGAHIGRYQAGLGIVSGKVVLDIACGSGYGTKLMATKAKKVFGVDVDEDTIKYANENYGADNVVFKLGDGVAIPLEDDSVDVVVSYETIEHIDDYEKFLKEVKRVLKPDGLLLLSTPNDEEYIEDNHYHLHEFKYGELKKLVGKYFKHRKDYFQTLWLYSSILPLDYQTDEWVKPIKTIGTQALNPEDCIYFFMLCSDIQIQEDIEPQGVLGEHYKLKDVQANNLKNHQKHISLVELKERYKQVTETKDRLENELISIRRSKLWRAEHKVRQAKGKIIKTLKK